MRGLKCGATICLGAVSYVVLASHLEISAHAQSTSLPPVNVQPPEQRAARSAAPTRPSQAARAARRSQAARSTTAPVQQPAVTSQGERADGHVDGYVAKLTATGSKTSTPIRELPQTVNVITADQIRDQGAQSVSQALRYTSGVLAETYGAASQFDTYTQIRGFTADFFLDGQRLPNGASSTGWASSVLEPFALERIEVLKGPASALYGQAVPGGLINMVSKRPTETPIGEVQLQTGSFGRAQIGVDVGGPVDKDKKLTYRFVAIGRGSGTQVDFIQNNRAYLAPSFTWRPDLGTSFTVLGTFQSEWGGKTGFNYVPTSGTLLPNPYGRIPFNRYLGEPTFDTFDRQQASIGYLFEHHFDKVFTVRQNVRYFESDVDLRALNRFGELAANQRTLTRFAFGIDAGAKALTVDNQVQADFQTGPFTHVALFGVDYRKEDNRYNVGRVAAPSIDVWNPVYGLPITDPGTTNFQRSNSQENQVGVYAQDQIKLANWVFTMSGRWDDAQSTSYVSTGAIPRTTQDPQAFTGRVGLNYLFDNGLTPYISYATSFRPVAGANFDAIPYKPTTGEQIEGGLKYQPNNSRTLMTLALFDIVQQNRLVSENNPARPNSSFQVGEVRVRGVEVEARTEITDGLNLIASYAHLDHEITKGTAAEIGRKLSQTPNDQGSVWAFYEVQGGALWGLGFGGGYRYVGDTYDSANTRITPSYGLYDAAIKWDFGKQWPRFKGAVLSINAFNLFDKYYLTECQTGQGCTLGFRRSALATLSYRW